MGRSGKIWNETKTRSKILKEQEAFILSTVGDSPPGIREVAGYLSQRFFLLILLDQGITTVKDKSFALLYKHNLAVVNMTSKLIPKPNKSHYFWHYLTLPSVLITFVGKISN